MDIENFKKENTFPIEKEKSNTNIFIVTAGVLVLFVLSFILYFILNFGKEEDNENKVSGPDSIYEILLEENKNFAEGEHFLRNGEEDRAASFYKRALLDARNSGEEGQILYKISIAETHGDPFEAIDSLKKVIEDPAQSHRQRAYAAQRLALIYYRRSDPTLFEKIFEDEPYASFRVNGEVDESLKNIFEYASFFYPLAVAELRAASWYANELKFASMSDNQNDFETLMFEYLPIIENKIRNAEEDIRRTQNSKDASDLIPEALYLKALTFARLNFAGIERNYEVEYKRAIEYALASGIIGSDGSARYSYAANLMIQEEDREQDIEIILKPFVENITQYESFERFFREERDDVLGQKRILVQISEINANFKELLFSLGWEDSDFNS